MTKQVVMTGAGRTIPLIITCRELDSFMVDYLEDTLSKQQRRKFNLHLYLCRDCRRYLEAYKRAITLSQAAFHDHDESIPQELLKAILAARDEDA